MEKVLKELPASNWSAYQIILISVLGLLMLWVLQRSGWDLSYAIPLAISALSCWMSFRSARKKTKEATTERERLDVNWQLSEITLAVGAVLAMCLNSLKH
jgi:hypothetical protein